MGKLLDAIHYCKVNTTYKDCVDCPIKDYGNITCESIRWMDDNFANELMKEYEILAEKVRENNG